MARLSGACCHTGTNRLRGEGEGRGRGEGGKGRVCKPVSRPVGGTGADFYENSSHRAKGIE